MKIKLLVIIASFFILPLAITSCLGSSDNDYELSSDDTITAFELDKIYGVNYKFTIDQARGEIYNQDSVPYSSDTIINKILITTLAASPWIVTGDTIFNINDSVDFKQTMTDEGEIKPLEFKVNAPNGETSKTYKIWVNRHRVDPDSLVWGTDPYTQSFTGGQIAQAQATKMITLGNHVLMFASNGANLQIYWGPSKNAWTPIVHETTDTPARPLENVNVHSAITFNDEAYIIANSGSSIYRSKDGETWESVANDITWTPAGNLEMVTLITSFYSKDDNNGNLVEKNLAAIVKDNNSMAFATAVKGDAGELVWTKGATVPSDFPTGTLSATKSFTTLTGGQQAMLISSASEEDTATTPWFSEDGLDWGKMVTTAKYALPKWKKPTILHYGNTLYAFGGAYNSDATNDFSSIYTSVNGIVWTEIKRGFFFPNNNGVSKFKGRKEYSITVDKDHYIWMGWGNNSDEVWRGKLNRVAFDKQ